MKLRVYVEDLEDGRRQEVVGYVDGAGAVEVAVQQADPGKARTAAAALIAAGRAAAEELSAVEEVEREAGELAGLPAAA